MSLGQSSLIGSQADHLTQLEMFAARILRMQRLLVIGYSFLLRSIDYTSASRAQRPAIISSSESKCAKTLERVEPSVELELATSVY